MQNTSTNNLTIRSLGYDISSGTIDFTFPTMTKIIKDFRPIVEKVQRGRRIYLDNITPLMVFYPLIQAIQTANSFDTTKVAETWQNRNWYIGSNSFRKIISI